MIMIEIIITIIMTIIISYNDTSNDYSKADNDNAIDEDNSCKGKN